MACSAVISGLVRDCEPSMGGIKRLLAIEYESVTAKTLDTSDHLISAITLATGKKFVEYYLPRESTSMTSTLNKDVTKGLHSVSTEVAAQFNRMDTTKRIEMAALSLNELVLLVQDANGKWWYLGYDEPVIANAGGGESGKVHDDGNRYTITFTDISASFPYEVDGDIIANLLAS